MKRLVRDRSLIALTAALSVAPGCKIAFDYAPVSPSEVRAAAANVAAGRAATMRDANGGVHAVTGDARLQRGDLSGSVVLGANDGSGQETGLDAIGQQCLAQGTAPPQACPLDNPKSAWQLKIRKDVPDWDLIAADVAGLGFLGGLVTGNVACFATDVCSNGTRTAVVVVDVVLVSVVVLVGIAWAIGMGKGRWS